MTRLGIYVQVPFCQTKCTYCNFHTGVVSAARFAPYAEAVCREIRGHRELLKAAGVDWPGRLGGSSRAPIQEITAIAGEVGRRPAPEGRSYMEGEPRAFLILNTCREFWTPFERVSRRALQR
jgi:hypothetical protein